MYNFSTNVFWIRPNECIVHNLPFYVRDDPKYICAVGFEPNPNHVAPLKKIEHAYLECGWRAHFFTETAVSNYSGTTKFFTDHVMKYKVGMRWPPYMMA